MPSATGRQILRRAAKQARRRAVAAQLPSFSDPKSPKTFRQWQLLACLYLSAWCDLTYRETSELITRCAGIRLALSLPRPPHYTTLQKFEARCWESLPAALANELVGNKWLRGRSVGLRRRLPGLPERRAIDSITRRSVTGAPFA